ncbi:MAG TPA: DUF1501 domain-containing protein [Frankiaceae bacterium]|nr:DUF1501 domain-containing protein [Frankiaceae bacterium]
MSARTPSRRDVLKAGAGLAGLHVLAPVTFRGSAAWAAGADPATKYRYRLVVVNLAGGNDGLNTVVPSDGPIRDVYDQVRIKTEIARTVLRALGGTNGGSVGLNPNLSYLHKLWEASRVAVVQGVEYPDPNYSHFIGDDIWQSGVRDRAPRSGWLGRHLDRVGIGEGELRGIGMASSLPLSLYGDNLRGQQVASLTEAQFRDGSSTAPRARHAAFKGYDAATGLSRATYGDTCAAAYDLAVGTAGLTIGEVGGLSRTFLTARELMTANLGVEVVFISAGGYDTHDKQTSRHATLLRNLDLGLEAFWEGTQNGTDITTPAKTVAGSLPGSTVTIPGTAIGALDPTVAERTLVVTFSEFGRRIGDTDDGTDHGAAAPMFLVGPPPAAAGSGMRRLVPGLHRDHPSLGTVLSPAVNLMPTTDFRNVYQSVLTGWLGTAGDPAFVGVAPGTGVNADGTLSGLFGTA